MNEETELLRRHLILQHKFEKLRILCAIVFVMVSLNGFGSYFQDREIHQARQKLKKAEARIAELGGQAKPRGYYGLGDELYQQWYRAELELAGANEKLATIEKDHQKTLSDFDRTLRAYEAAYQKEHGLGTEPPGVPQNDPRYFKRVGPQPPNKVLAND